MRSITLAIALVLGTGSLATAYAHEGHFSAGEPGDPNMPARTVTVTMRDDDGAMRFEPARIEVKKGEQIRFVIANKGVLKHEFTLASVAENKKHGAMMQKFPDMEHDDPNAKSAEPGKTAEILWRFTNAGAFEFACLIPGHYEAGMHGAAIVK
ncbi:copper resistance protein [Pseudolabrys taiwanensis]|uniref:Copper resistance protein n=1 Tax=Pseudolabrys taiwanensis TaxID=331696 RepID=A0A345ZZ69_9HYPH|nr:cupredoxin family protein [Pseudolabrys taiwanensis]AXK82216.1 copper resistance protein [Pseudolabrys taiwanensis]